MARAKMNAKRKLMAYILNTDEDFQNTQTEIATLLHVTQSTVSNAIKDARHMIEVRGLKEELANAKQQLLAAGIQPNRNILDITPKKQKALDGTPNMLSSLKK